VRKPAGSSPSIIISPSEGISVDDKPGNALGDGELGAWRRVESQSRLHPFEARARRYERSLEMLFRAVWIALASLNSSIVVAKCRATFGALTQRLRILARNYDETW